MCHWKEIILGLLFINILSFSSIKAQDKTEDIIKVNISFEHYKYTDHTKALKANLFYREGRTFLPVTEKDVGFYAIGDTTEVFLASISTDENGEAYMLISEDYLMPEISPGITLFKVRFDGSEKYSSAEAELNIKDLILDFKLSEIDSVKTIEVFTQALDDNGEMMPVEDVEIYIYVKRLHSYLIIGEEYSDEEGYTYVEFPGDLPGDSVGNVTIIVQVPESDEYGTVEEIKNINWGLPVSYEVNNLPRALWSDEAPLWMIIGVFVVLLGAWFNFGLAIYFVTRVKKEGIKS